MLTRLRVSGFKNLVDVDVHFGPFTCLAGANGVGKSNLFDAIGLLSTLADLPLAEAGRGGSVRGLFHRVGTESAREMELEAEMIVPPTALDDLGRPARATITFLRYSLGLRWRQDGGGMEVVREDLARVHKGSARSHLPFGPSPAWRRSAVKGHRRGTHFLATGMEGERRAIHIHQDGGVTGRPRAVLAAGLARTVLSTATSAESPTAVVARREMQSWRRFAFHPAALRKPDALGAPAHLAFDGAHLPATLRRLGGVPGQTRFQVVRDEARERLELVAVDPDGARWPAGALASGDLRFLALEVLAADPLAPPLVCLEEPENGIHPERIPALLELLKKIATDPAAPVGPENPLRQVIAITHSPAVVSQALDDSLLVAEATPRERNGSSFPALSFACLPNTWRADHGASTVDPARLAAYLRAAPRAEVETVPAPEGERRPRRVADRSDLQMDLF